MDTYWRITISGAVLILLANIESNSNILKLFVENNSTNPFKIIILFLSLTFISKFLDAVGLFDFLATRVGRIGNGNQYILFTIFYFLISFLTILTNNDIIIIVTPIIVYFARACHAKSLPYEFIPFLISMFVTISALNETPLLKESGSLFASIPSPVGQTFAYGITNVLSANLVNNVPMSLLYADILHASGTMNLNHVHACILASNVCALLPPAAPFLR